jgi:dynein heavy chain 1
MNIYELGEDKSSRLTSTLLLIKMKRNHMLTPEEPWSKQLLLFPLSNVPLTASEFCDILYLYIHNVIMPTFNAFIDSKPTHGPDSFMVGGTMESFASIPLTKKKIAELEVSLLQLKQEAEIPEVHLQPNQQISEYLEKVCTYYIYRKGNVFSQHFVATYSVKMKKKNTM